VQLLRERLPDAVDVGREAPVVFTQRRARAARTSRAASTSSRETAWTWWSRARSASPTSSARRGCSRSTADRADAAGERALPVRRAGRL